MAVPTWLGPNRLARIKRIRELIFQDTCQFFVAGAGPSSRFDQETALRFLEKKPFLFWILESGCFEIYNRLYLHDPVISSLHDRLHAFIASIVASVTEYLHQAVSCKPILFKSTELLFRFGVRPLGRTVDLDVVYPATELSLVYGALSEQGWVRGAYKPGQGIVHFDNAVISNYETGRYETLPFGKIFELVLSHEELECVKRYVNGAFFDVVEFGEASLKFRFDIDVHWNYARALDPTLFRLQNSVHPHAATIDDSDHLYIMLLRNCDDAAKNVGKLRNVVLALLLLKHGRIDPERIYASACRDGRLSALGTNLALLEGISPVLANALDPERRLAPHLPSLDEIMRFRNALLNPIGYRGLARADRESHERWATEIPDGLPQQNEY